MTTLQRPNPGAIDAGGSANWLLTVGRLARFVLARTFADPIREGRLRSVGWPPGLRSIAAVAVVVYTALMLVAVFATAIRGHDGLIFVSPGLSLPTVAVPLVATGLVLALSCLFTAALHTAPPFRVGVTVMVMAILLYPIDWTDAGRADVVVAALTAGLPALVLVRARRRFHWLELVLSLAIIGHAVLAYQVLGIGPLATAAPGLRLTALTQLTNPVWALAVPVSILAGAALVEITTAAVTWTATGVWARIAHRPRTRRWTAAVLVVLVFGRAVQEASRLTDASDPVAPSRLVIAAVLVLGVYGGCALATGLADRTAGGDPRQRPDPDDLLSTWHRCAPFLAVALAANVVLQLLISVLLRGFGFPAAASWFLHLGGSGVILTTALVTTGVALAAAALLSRRGWRRTGLLLAAFGTMFGAQSICTALHLITTTEDMLALTSALAVGVLVVSAVRRRLTLQAEVAIAGVLLLGLAFAYRDWMTEPLTALVSLTGVSAALLVGLVWRLLTDNGFTRGDSPGFPQASRVLLALANALVGVTFAALLALFGGRYVLDLSQAEQLGDSALGFPLVLAVVFAGLTLAAGGREVRRPLRSARAAGRGS